MKILTAILLGIVLGIVNAKLLTGAWYSLSFWGLSGILLGWWALRKKEAVFVGAIFGFIVSFSFLVADYTGVRPITSVIVLFIILSLFGAICGVILAIGGFFLRKLRKHS